MSNVAWIYLTIFLYISGMTLLFLFLSTASEAWRKQLSTRKVGWMLAFWPFVVVWAVVKNLYEKGRL